MTLYNEWLPAEATIDVDGELRTVHAPSKVGLYGAIGHLANPSSVPFIRALGTNRPINYIVDVGANIGGTALLFHSAFPEARLLAIEPMEINYDCLARNIADIPQITLLKMAAHDKRCKIRIAMPTSEQRKDIPRSFGNSGLFSVYGQDDEHSETVAADMLDNMVDGRVDLLKIDVEGAELLVLSGAERIITKDRPIVIMELRPANILMSGNTMCDTERWGKRMGYEPAGQYMGDLVLFPIEADPPPGWGKTTDQCWTKGAV